VKIIDYGRSFFKGALGYYQKVCAEKACAPDCGLRKGFATFHPDRRVEIAFGCANTAYKNESHDLRLMDGYKEILNTGELSGDNVDVDYRKILEDTVYRKGTSTRSYGTVEDLTKSHQIRNVSDAYRRWEDYILAHDNQAEFIGLDCLGDLHIYTDGRDMEYMPTVSL
jgi:hypothetical protein